METLIQLIVSLFFVGTLSPPRWGLRIAALMALLLTLAAIAFANPDISNWDSILFLALPWLCGPILSGVAVRSVLKQVLSSSQADAAPTDQRILAGADQILLAGIRVCLGCLAIRALAVQLQATDGGLTLHITVAALALLVPAALWQSRLRSIGLGAGLLVAVLSLDGGLRYPDLILTDANRREPGQPRCLMLAPSLQPPRTRADLMGLTMAKDRSSPSAALLLIETDPEPRLYRWSFRNRSFVRAPDHLYAVPLCTPTKTTLSLR